MKINTRLIILIGIVLLLIISINNKCYAALQANGKEGTLQRLDEWIVNIRKMEALGGGMGLTESIQTNLTPTTPSNNLDIHMEKNSEYGAMAILSASSYGNPNKINDGGTTTGNKTGIVIRLNRELVAIGHNGIGNQAFTTTNFKLAHNKYKQVYDLKLNNGSQIPLWSGDALTETLGWHGSTSTWFEVPHFGPSAMVRGFKNSIFGYHSFYDSTGNNAWQDTKLSRQLYSRAAMVCGEGI